MKEMKIVLNPKIGVTPFEIGEQIDYYLEIYPFNYIKGEVDESWDEYDFFDESVELYVNKDSKLIESICCRINCYYKNINLINYDFDDFLHLIVKDKHELEKEEVWLENDEKQTVYEINDMSLQVWVDTNNKIKTVFIS